MAAVIFLDEWVIIPIGDCKTLFGRETGMKTYRITSAVTDIDSLMPPRWAVTSSGNRYNLTSRATIFSKYAYAAALDTLIQRGYPIDDVLRSLEDTARLISEMNSAEAKTAFSFR